MVKSASPPSINVAQKYSQMMGLTLTAPAAIALIAYLIFGLVVILPFDIPMTDQETGKDYIVKYDFVQRFIVVLLMAIPIALSIYSINCMVAGNCLLWSYVVSTITVFWILMFIVTAVAFTIKK